MCSTTAQPPRKFRALLALATSLLALAASALLACTPTSEGVPPFPGRSTRPPGGPTAAPTAAAQAPVRWDRWPELVGWRVAIARSPSQHLAADHEAETLTSPEAASYPHLGPARRLPPGSALVQRLYTAGATTPEVLFVMVRRADPETPSADGSSWEYFVLDPDGFITARGALPTCVRCHAEASHDGLFGRAQ